MDTTGTVRNAFGYRRKFFDRIEGTVYNEGVAWIGQSTTSIIINKGLVAIDEWEEENHGGLQLLMQVHDSLVGQFPTAETAFFLDLIRALCTITVPYEDPMVMPVGIKTSTISWGDCS
jgi:DNA polymerase I-like protein with 3'-5' exonuclease and polymerase domains